MRSGAADRLLEAVRRRLRSQRVAASLRTAAWLTAVVALVAATLHLFVRPVDVAELLVAMAAIWLPATLSARSRVISQPDCAAWADRNLDGACAFGTYVEHHDDTAIPAAIERRLLESLERSAASGAARLDAMPSDLRLRKPLAVAAVGLLLAVTLLQVPMPTRSTGRDSGATVAASKVGSAAPAPVAASVGDGGSPPATSDARVPPGPPSEAGGAANGPSAAARALDDADAVPTDDAEDVASAMSAARAGAGGREAGATADTTTDDSTLTAAWQGAMAAKFRELAPPPETASRADATLAATYAQNDAAVNEPSHGEVLRPAAAVPPQARRESAPGPAEQAYVRAYLADNGVEP